jgi:hypothetical protein
MKFNAYVAWTIPAPGTVIAGKYEVETECGRDGLAAILSAVHLGLGRRVVIRVLLPEWADDPQAIEQFRRDGRAAARAASDVSPRLFDAGKLDGGAPYQALDYLGDHEFAAVDRPASRRERIPGVHGSDRVMASALLMLGALGTAAFMWLYSTVHEHDGQRVGATLMQPTTNILDDAGADGGVDTHAAAVMESSPWTNTPARVTQGGVDAGPFGEDAAPARAAVPPLAPVSPATPSLSDPRSRGAGSEGRSDGTSLGTRARTYTYTEPRRPQRTVVHVAPTSATDPDSTNPYDSPTSGTAPEESPRARRGEAATPDRFPNETDNATESQERFLDRRQ